MKWHEELADTDPKLLQEAMRLSGCLDLKHPDEYEALSHLICDACNIIIEAKALIEQGSKRLNMS